MSIAEIKEKMGTDLNELHNEVERMSGLLVKQDEVKATVAECQGNITAAKDRIKGHQVELNKILD